MKLDRKLLCAAALALCAFGGVATAAPIEKGRLDQYAGLPDWSGYWRVKDANGLLDPNVKAAKGTSAYRDHPPYNAEWEAKYVNALKGMQGPAPTVKDSYGEICLLGAIRLWSHGGQIELSPTPELTAIHYFGEVRFVVTDGRAFPHPDSMFEEAHGWTIGKWNKGVLSAETKFPSTLEWSDDTPLLFSEQVAMKEVFRRKGPKAIEVAVTITDPISMTKPWTFTRTLEKTDDFSNKAIWMTPKEVCFKQNAHLTR